jgi:hypothetical protein
MLALEPPNGCCLIDMQTESACVHYNLDYSLPKALRTSQKAASVVTLGSRRRLMQKASSLREGSAGLFYTLDASGSQTSRASATLKQV